MIACIGWGSLIWDRRNLDVDGRWRPDGSAVEGIVFVGDASPD